MDRHEVVQEQPHALRGDLPARQVGVVLRHALRERVVRLGAVEELAVLARALAEAALDVADVAWQQPRTLEDRPRLAPAFPLMPRFPVALSPDSHLAPIPS